MMRSQTIEAQMGTWGMVLKPNKSYRVVFEQPFHLKMAVLNFNGFIKQEFNFRIMLVDNFDEKPPLTLCVLNKLNVLQTHLDLHFEKNDDVTLYVQTEAFNMDSNSFSVHLSGVSTRDPEVFSKRPTTLSLIQRDKNRSSSLPDEYFHKRGLPSPTGRNPPASALGSPVRPSVTTPCMTPTSMSPPDSPFRKAMTPESSPQELPKSPKIKEPKDKSLRGSFRGGDVLGKLGKLLSKS